MMKHSLGVHQTTEGWRITKMNHFEALCHKTKINTVLRNVSLQLGALHSL